jgi:transcriptional antiterminator RfaH
MEAVTMFNDGGLNKAWYLIFTKPKMERVAQANLERQQYQIFLPRIQISKRLRGRYTRRIEAMFPRYLFIHLDTVHDNWMPIRSTLGVSHMVRFGGLPAQVPEALITELMANQDDNGVNVTQRREILHGDRVEILDGPMAGYVGLFEQHCSAERVQILLKIVGNETRVNIDRHQIQLAV